jgi:hypothetical protein
MVLYPIDRAREESGQMLSAWDAIEHKQKQPAADWWLISQPDHAALSGTLARSIDSRDFPKLDEEAIQAITLHDDGWTTFDDSPRLSGRRPMSFLDVAAPDFLQAWRGSIERAENASALAGLMVSEHFCRIARARPQTHQTLIDRFLQEERERQARLFRSEPRSTEEVSVLVDVLQFCDLLSLYLCCGSQASIVFPQEFRKCAIRCRREDQLCRIEPPVLGGGASLAVPARRFSNFRHSETIPVLLG